MKHLMIIWSNAEEFEREITNDINDSFNLNFVLKVKWEIEFFQQNLGRLYCHSLIEKTKDQKREILKDKEIHCGNEAFTVILFDDHAPVIKESKTSSGYSFVNIKVFKKKEDYRRLTGGGHKIHITDNDFEFEKDFLFLFGHHSNDYLDELAAICKNEKLLLNQNLIGVPQWESISDVFKVLNVSQKYVVLRNFECLPEEYHVEGHGDIDLLVENYELTKEILDATSIFPNKPYRVYHTIKINDENIPFDLRFIGDQHYDVNWEKDILETRELDKNGFYKPSNKNYFYSLMYHAFVHKKVQSDDYLTRLEGIAKRLNIKITINSHFLEFKDCLMEFMEINNYLFTLPLDHTVYVNKYFLDGVENIQEGELISSSFVRTNEKAYITEVYKNGDLIKKIGDQDIIFKELNGLKLMSGTGLVPKIISTDLSNSYPSISMEYINGIELLYINNLKEFWKLSNIRLIVDSCLKILIFLIENKLIHRDIRPNNIILRNKGHYFEPVLIDFGWSIGIKETDYLNPNGLGERYKFPGNGYSDIYSMGLVLKTYFGRFSFVKNIYQELLKVDPSYYTDGNKLMEHLNFILREYQESNIRIVDYFVVYVKKYRVMKFIRKLKKKIFVKRN